MTQITFPQAGQLTALPPLSLYIHIPWCIKKCPYCDFNSHSLKNGLPEAAYIDALLTDLQLELPNIWGRPVETIFFGGGTPSLFQAESIDRLLSGVRSLLRLQPEAEITLEANPGTFEIEKFQGFKDAGITRLSIGVQSFNDDMLSRLGRVHNGKEALNAIDTALKLFDKVNIDLMYALPNQTVQTALDELGIDKIDGALFDLGISSPQIDDGSRGFSFRFDAPLDMRMDPTRGMSAAEWIATASEQDLHEVIKNYGEERFSRQIARAIVAQREESPIDTTRKLAQLVAQNVRTRERGQDPATRTFQAIRIFINRELEEVEAVLPQVAGRLKEGGRLAVIAFHSLEDRIVKQFIKKYSQHAPLPRWAVVKEADLPQPPLKAVGKAIKPGSAETEANPRARSAVLRVAERSSGEISVVD